MPRSVQIGLLATLVISLLSLWWSNPSRQQHLAQSARVALQREQQHAAACDRCQTASSLQDWEERVGTVNAAEGVEYQNYLFFSALSKQGLGQARTIGVVGLVFGPAMPEFPCPAPLFDQIALPEPEQFGPNVPSLDLPLNLDGALCDENGLPLSDEELQQRILAAQKFGQLRVTLVADERVLISAITASSKRLEQLTDVTLEVQFRASERE